jgi:hypothetical protein
MKRSIANSRSVPREVFLVLLFVAVNGLLTLPCLCPGGEIASQFKLALVLLVTVRLVASIVLRSFRFSSFCGYFAVVMAFCVWADMQY